MTLVEMKRKKSDTRIVQLGEIVLFCWFAVACFGYCCCVVVIVVFAVATFYLPQAFSLWVAFDP